jgi:hypothetical protein
MTTESGKQFLDDFFEAGGYHPNGARALEHFRSAFVFPPRFKNLVADLKPAIGEKKVVVVDGHPRSGKTWCVVKALEEVIDQLELSPDEWWTSGLDSLKVSPTDASDLYNAACQVQLELAERPALRLLFLDDFFGTNQPRPLGSAVYDQSARPFFRWNEEENPWLQCLRGSSGYTLVITGRSLHLTLADILLDLKIRERATATSDIIVLNQRHGLFRTFDKGEPFGAFEKETLKEVCKRNREHHPLKDDGDPDWLIIAAPLLAFDEDKDQHITEQQKEYAASALFGEDVESLAEKLTTVEELDVDSDILANWRYPTLDKLYKSYLVTIAPGLLFLDPSAYESLLIKEEISELVVRSLYLYESIDEFRSGRLPNEFYMIAINEHLERRIDLAARVFVQLVNPSGNELEGTENIPALGIRGLLERGQHKRVSGALDRLLEVREFRELVDFYLRKKNDCLLHLERNKSDLNSDCLVRLNPGLAAAIGWALYNFFDRTEHRVRTTVVEWFPARFEALLRECNFQSSATESGLNITSGRNVVATYSTFLQWVIKMDTAPVEDGLLDNILKLPDKCPEVLEERLRIVLEDELLWALNLNYDNLRTLPRVKEILEFISEERTSSATWTDKDTRLSVNRLFALAWHNEWLDKGDEDFREKASDWIQVFRQDILERINAKPELLDDNLRYHWCHFITQRAVWMRDWCFQNDPNEFERSYSQITRGSQNPDHNDLIADIATALVQNENISSRRIRNMLLLVGTRAERIREIGKITGEIDKLLDAKGCRDEDMAEAVLQAIFELARQGFLDKWSGGIVGGFDLWCQEKMNALHAYLDEAWLPYWTELEDLTHLDLLPRKEKGWMDVLPRHWPRAG